METLATLPLRWRGSEWERQSVEGEVVVMMELGRGAQRKMGCTSCARVALIGKTRRAPPHDGATFGGSGMRHNGRVGDDTTAWSPGRVQVRSRCNCNKTNLYRKNYM